MQKQNLSEHFLKYFSVLLADTEPLKKSVYKIRYDVYCKELEYEKDCPIDCEKDTFDAYSQHVLIRHNTSREFAGCVRLIIPPRNEVQLALPFEANCIHSIYDDKKCLLSLDNRAYIGELSRLAVHQTFRRRATDASTPDGVDAEQPLVFTASELRFFPFISVALYLACTSIALRNKIRYIFVMMEPRLARLLSRSSINFTQIGEVIDYHGSRAMFYIDRETFFQDFKPELVEFYEHVDGQLNSKVTRNK